MSYELATATPRHIGPERQLTSYLANMIYEKRLPSELLTQLLPEHLECVLKDCTPVTGISHILRQTKPVGEPIRNGGSKKAQVYIIDGEKGPYVIVDVEDKRPVTEGFVVHNSKAYKFEESDNAYRFAKAIVHTPPELYAPRSNPKSSKGVHAVKDMIH